MTEEVAHAVAAEASDPVDREKCIRQLVLIAVRKLKYLLYHLVTDLYIAGNVIRSISQKDIKY
jgi:hypothetical protein